MEDQRLLVQQAISEFVGPFALVFLGAGSIIMTGGENLVAIALAHGLAIGIMVAATGHISGGLFNPALTVGLAVTGRLTPVKTAVFIVAQLLGAIVAALALIAIFPSSQVDAVELGVPALGVDIDASGALLAELVLTFFLMWVVFGSAVDQRSNKAVAALAIGLTITADVLAMGAVTGAAMNPARHFGPALVQGVWSDWWVWWVGPIVGAAIAAIVYNFVLFDEDVPGAAPDDDEGAQLPDRGEQAPRRSRRRGRR